MDFLAQHYTNSKARIFAQSLVALQQEHKCRALSTEILSMSWMRPSPTCGFMPLKAPALQHLPVEPPCFIHQELTSYLFLRLIRRLVSEVVIPTSCVSFESMSLTMKLKSILKLRAAALIVALFKAPGILTLILLLTLPSLSHGEVLVLKSDEFKFIWPVPATWEVTQSLTKG